jgi:uncharacterized protein (TIGR02001 family)
MKRLIVVAASAAAILFPSLASAKDEADAPTKALTLSGGISAVTDYRFRGYSLSERKPAIQPTLTVTHKSGVYAGGWGSNLRGSPVYGKVELDLYGGWSGEIAGGTSLDAGLVYYYYPDGQGPSDYAEPYATISHGIGPLTAKAGINWAPSQSATARENWTYVFGQLSADIPKTPVTLTGRLGHQDFGSSRYTEWALGAQATLHGVTAGVQYGDTNVTGDRNAKAGVLGTLNFSF